MHTNPAPTQISNPDFLPAALESKLSPELAGNLELSALGGAGTLAP